MGVILLSDNWTQLIKKVSMQERVASRPCTTVTGKVLGVNPIKIGITQQLILDENFILIPAFLVILKWNLM